MTTAQQDPATRRQQFPLTPRQREVLEAICCLWSRDGVPPTFRALCEVLSVKSPNGISELLRPLERKGWITFVCRSAINRRGLSRNIRLLAAPEGWKLLPNNSVMSANMAREWVLSEHEAMEVEAEEIIKELEHDEPR